MAVKILGLCLSLRLIKTINIYSDKEIELKKRIFEIINELNSLKKL